MRKHISHCDYLCMSFLTYNILRQSFCKKLLDGFYFILTHCNFCYIGWLYAKSFHSIVFKTS